MTADLRPAAGGQTGKGVAIASIAAGGNSSVVVTFPQAYSAAPVITVAPTNGRLNWSIASISGSSVTISFVNWTTATAGASSFDWSATPA